VSISARHRGSVERTRVRADDDRSGQREAADVAAFSLDGVVAALLRDGSSKIVPTNVGHPPVDGFSVGVVERMDSPPPHRGEMHPDGDELLYLVSGRVRVVLDDGDQERVGSETRHDVGAGEAFIVPRGAWHRLEVIEPAHLVHVTPGPRCAHRPV